MKVDNERRRFQFQQGSIITRDFLNEHQDEEGFNSNKVQL